MMPLTRNRRRVLIATLLAISVLVAWSVWWPRRDPRFVGSWAIGKRSAGPIVLWAVKRTYNADGTMQSISAGDPAPEDWQWKIDGNVLVEYDATSNLPAPLQEIYGWLTGRYQLRDTTRYQILSVADDEIRLRRIGQPEADDIRLERLDEPAFDTP